MVCPGVFAFSAKTPAFGGTSYDRKKYMDISALHALAV